MPEKRNTNIASERVTRPDAAGVERLAAAPGDPIPDEETTQAMGLTMAPQQWDDTNREFTASPGDPNPDAVDAANAAQGHNP
jgi:acyl dehydratase